MSIMKTQHLENIVGHLGTALRQQSPSDDKIIMDHIQKAYDAAKKALIVAEGRDHYHVAGTTVGKHIDECAVCGHDIRHPIHANRFTEESCPGHVASATNPKVCGRCGTHIDSLRPPIGEIP